MITCLMCRTSRKHMVLDSLGRCPACADACRYPSRPYDQPLRGRPDNWKDATGKRTKPVHNEGEE